MTTESVNQTLTQIPYSPVQYTPPIDHEAIQRALMAGDIAKLTPHDRVQFYAALCHSCGLNMLTRPFILLKGQDGGLHWYATVGAAEQLRRLHHVSSRIVSRERTDDGLYIVTVQAATPDGRQEEAQGIVYVGTLKGQELGNMMMRCQSKALRRATLALIGLGVMMADDDAGQVVRFDPQTGVLEEPVAPEPSAGALLSTIGQWLRQRPQASREVITRRVWGATLREMPHLGLDELQAGWARLDDGTAALDWASDELADELVAWLQRHAQEAIDDVFGAAEEEQA